MFWTLPHSYLNIIFEFSPATKLGFHAPNGYQIIIANIRDNGV